MASESYKTKDGFVIESLEDEVIYQVYKDYHRYLTSEQAIEMTNKFHEQFLNQFPA